jgi:HD superfamily phosphohydrolase
MMSTDLLPGPLNEPTERVRCPVHGFIRYSKNERKIIDHFIFQRLRNIRQLAMEYLVYPGATHTRFEHSLGVMDMAARIFDALVRRHRAEILEDLKQVPELSEDTIAKARQVIRLMGLLHDVGHPAFAHAGEAGIPDKKSHEKVSVYAIEHLLGDLLNATFFEGATSVLVRLMNKSEELAFLGQLVSGEVDVDRADYLLRDSLHCGVNYGVYDSNRLIESLTLIVDSDSGRLQLALDRGGEHTFEAMILARYQMSTQVYFHKIRRIYDHYLEEYCRIWGPEHYASLDDVLDHDDLSVTVDIRLDARIEGPKQEWAQRITQRRHHRVVHQTGDSADHQDLQRAKRMLTELRSRFDTCDFHLDDSQLSIYKLWVPGDQEEPKVENLFIKEPNGNTKLLTRDSAIIGKVPKRVRTVRIFSDGGPAAMTEVCEQVRKMEKSI